MSHEQAAATTSQEQAVATALRQALGQAAVSQRAIDRYGHAHDASHYLLVPHTLVTPRSTEQVAAMLRACHQLGTPVTFRSAGTSLSGQGVTGDVMADTRHAFRRTEVLDNGMRVRVQPGVTVAAVNRQLARYGRCLGPDPASESACTIGGVVANNSSGMQCGTALNTYNTLESMVMVLPSGTVIDTAGPEAARQLAQQEPDIHEGLSRLRRRIMAEPSSVDTITQQFAMKNTMGYGLNAFLDYAEPLDILTRLMIGSEGTLGFIAEATFATVPVYDHVATGLLVFPDVATATATIPELLETGTATAELLDAASLRVAQQDRGCPQAIADLHVAEQAAVLVEYQGASTAELAHRRATAEPVLARLPLDEPAVLTEEAAERSQLWRTRKGLYAAVAGARPAGTNALLEDIVVPVSRLGDTCQQLIHLFAEHDYRDPVIFGHARDGNLHFLLNERFDDAIATRRYEAFTEDMVSLVLGEGGSLKAEHGTGRIMAPFVRRQYGEELYDVMVGLKNLIDPAGMLGPGNVLSNDPSSYLHHLKTVEPVEEEVDRCVECGYCEPVCPSRDLTTTPRQRIVLRREIAAARRRGEDELASELMADYDYAAVQTCAVDGMCQAACPVDINTGDLVQRLRAEESGRLENSGWRAAAGSWHALSRTAARGLDLAHHMPPTLPVAATRLARRVLGPEHVPLYDPALPSGGPPRPTLADPEPAAVLFAACVGSMFGPEPGGHGATTSFITLCHWAGLGLRTPAGLGGLCCTTPWQSKGYRSGAEAMAAKVRRALAQATEYGRLPVVVDASSCAQGVGEVLTAEAAELQIEVLDATEFVATYVLPHLRRTRPVGSVVVHPTCASTALGSTEALVACAQFVSDDVTVPNEWGCCGFAGDRGLLHPELTASATRDEAAEVRQREYAAYVSANRTCELGMTRATGRPWRNVLELVAFAAS